MTVDQGDVLKSITHVTWMMSEDSSYSSSYTNLSNNTDDIQGTTDYCTEAHDPM
jgi:hypothetical protein